MNSTERYVYNLYSSINITCANQLSVDYLSSLLSIDIHYWGYSSELVCYKDNYKMFINENLNWRKQWQDFGHEMSHYCYEEENSMILNELYVDYCEYKADYFAYHFCVPTFMLVEMKGVTAYDIANLFNVEFDFALRRLEMYRNKMLMKGVL